MTTSFIPEARALRERGRERPARSSGREAERTDSSIWPLRALPVIQMTLDGVGNS